MDNFKDKVSAEYLLGSQKSKANTNKKGYQVIGKDKFLVNFIFSLLLSIFTAFICIIFFNQNFQEKSNLKGYLLLLFPLFLGAINLVNKPRLILNKKQKFLIGSVLILIIMLFVYLMLHKVNVGLNEEHFIRKDFEKIFNARVTGDCDKFRAFLLKTPDKWYERCLQEKMQNNAEPIDQFSIEKVSQNEERAFLQVRLRRDLYHTNLELKQEGRAEIEDRDYVVNYELLRQGFPCQWFLNQGLD